MSTTDSRSKTGIVKKLLVALGAATFILVSFLGGLVIFLPKLVSTAKFKSFLENQASSTINRRLQIEALQWKWTDEILIKNISIGDDPAFSNQPMFTAGRARIKIFFREMLKGRLHFDVILDGIHAGLIRNKQGKINVGLLPALLKQEKAARKKQIPMDLDNISFSVPFDIQGRVHLNQILIRIEDRVQGKQLSLQDAAVRLDIPSLYLEPITLKASADINLDDTKISSAHLNILIKKLFDSEGKLNLADTYIDMQGVCPGAEFVFHSDFSKLETKSRLEFDLLKFAKIFKPFILPQISPDEIRGNLKFIFDGSENPQETLSYSTALEGKDIIFSSGLFGGKTLGPLDFNMTNAGTLDPGRGRLVVESGALVFLKKSSLAWNGEVKDLYGAAPEADFKFESIRFDVGELFDTFRGVVPQNIKISANPEKDFPILEIKNAGFCGPLPLGPNNISIKDLVLKIPQLYFSLRESPQDFLSANSVRFAVKDFRSTLKDFFPAQMSLSASLITDSIYIKGAQDIYVNKLSIPFITVVSDEIHRSENPLMGLSAQFGVRQALSAGEISAASLITIKNLEQTLEAEVSFSAGTNAEMAIKNLKLKLPSLVVENSRYGPFITNAGLDISVAGISLPGTDLLDADIKGLKSELFIDNILAADFEADAENMASAFLRAKGNVFVDMAPLSEKLIARFFDKLKLTGETRLAWDIAGRLPNGREIEKLGSWSIDFKDDLDFVDKLDINCRSKGMGVDLNVSEGNHLKIESVSTGSPMRYRFDKKTGRGQIEGRVLLGGIKLPYNVFPGKHLNADIRVFGEHDYLDSVTLSQVATLKPANINHTLDVSLKGLDRIFKRNLKMPPPLWLKYAALSARGTLNVSDETNLSALIDGLDVEGRLASGAEVQLVPGEKIRLKGWTTTSGFDLKLKDIFNVKSLKTDVDLKKDYHIVGKDKTAEDGRRIKPLSVSVLKVEAEPVMGSAFERDPKGAVVAKFIGELQNRFAARHAVAFKSAHVGLGPLPLSVDYAMIGFDLNEGLPNSDYFQMDVLGGTVIGSVSILRQDDAFFLQTRLAFSGLNTGRLYPVADPKDSDDSDLSGRLWVRIPLSSRIDGVLREFQMDLKLSRIGSRALERFFYALDPTESNETIVSQRQLLRLGSPRWISATVKDGNLSLDGEVDAKGISVAMPRLRRLNIANLSALDNYAEHLDRLVPIIKVLKVFSANSIKIGADGRSIKFQTSK